LYPATEFMRPTIFPPSVILLSLLLFLPPSLANVVVNEISPWGSPEWVELYNPSNCSVNLSGWLLDTKPENADATIPEGAVIPAGGYFVIGDAGCVGDYEETIIIPDTAVYVALRNSSGAIIDEINLSGIFARTDNFSVQLMPSGINDSQNLSNWAVLPFTKGEKNKEPEACPSIVEISLEEQVFCGAETLAAVLLSNPCPVPVENAKVFFSAASLENRSQAAFESNRTINISGAGSAELGFYWTPENSGEYLICARLKGSRGICKNVLFLPPPQKTARLDVALGDTLMAGIGQESLFRIEIEYKAELEGGCGEKDNVSVKWSVSNASGQIAVEGNFTAEVGCSKTAGTGFWLPEEEGSFMICGEIYNASAAFDSSAACKNLTVTDPAKINCSLKLSLSAPPLWFSGDRQEYEITVEDGMGYCKGCPVEIDYTIDDFFGEHMSSYPKRSQKNVGSKSKFSYTPKIACGSAAYVIKAKISRAFCNDLRGEDNSVQEVIAVIGSAPCQPCPKCSSSCDTSDSASSKTETTSTTSTSKAGGLIQVTIANLTESAPRGGEITAELKIRNTDTVGHEIEVYSYAYVGSSCVTGSWTANRQNLTIPAGGETAVTLTNKIRETALPGEYTFRARAKLGDKEFDADSKITVTEGLFAEAEEVEQDAKASSAGEPESPPEQSPTELKIWNDTKLRINLTNCDGCVMLIETPKETVLTSKKYRVFEAKGEYRVFAIKGNELLANRTYFWGVADIESAKNEALESGSNPPPTGEFIGTRGGGITGSLRSAFGWIIRIMEESIAAG
ncbi:MAG: lamin tail domain-containing protein, partial [Candidatus Aenigmatarchaeota archaeon]